MYPPSQSDFRLNVPGILGPRRVGGIACKRGEA